MSSEAEAGLGPFLLALRAAGFGDNRLMAAVERAPRPDFVPAAFRELAWRNISLPLPCGQETGPPLQAVRVAAEVAERRPDRLLEVGTGSGWQTALLAGLVERVRSVERFRTLAEAAGRRLAGHGHARVMVRTGNGLDPDPEGGPFDMIVLNGSLAEAPAALLGQLASGGALLLPRRHTDGRTVIELVERRGEGWSSRAVGETVTGPLVPSAARAL